MRLVFEKMQEENGNPKKTAFKRFCPNGSGRKFVVQPYFSLICTKYNVKYQLSYKSGHPDSTLTLLSTSGVVIIKLLTNFLRSIFWIGCVIDALKTTLESSFTVVTCLQYKLRVKIRKPCLKYDHQITVRNFVNTTLDVDYQYLEEPQ